MKKSILFLLLACMLVAMTNPTFGQGGNYPHYVVLASLTEAPSDSKLAALAAERGGEVVGLIQKGSNTYVVRGFSGANAASSHVRQLQASGYDAWVNPNLSGMPVRRWINPSIQTYGTANSGGARDTRVRSRTERIEGQGTRRYGPQGYSTYGAAEPRSAVIPANTPGVYHEEFIPLGDCDYDQEVLPPQRWTIQIASHWDTPWEGNRIPRGCWRLVSPTDNNVWWVFYGDYASEQEARSHLLEAQKAAGIECTPIPKPHPVQGSW